MKQLPKEKRFVVYKHTSPNGKVYIGITSRKPNIRWKNGKGYDYNTHFYNAIKKYGWDNFKHEILFKDLKEEEAFEKEIELINKYDSANSEKGYNKVVGNGGFKTGENHHNYRKAGERNRNTITIICLNTKKIYNSIVDASEELKEPKQSIRGVLNKIYKATSKGFKFEYYYDYLVKHPKIKMVRDLKTGIVYNSVKEVSEMYNLDKQVIKNICENKYVNKYKDMELEYVSKDFLLKEKETSKNNCKKVIDLKSNIIYDSTGEVGKIYGVSAKVIRNICKHTKKKDIGINVMYLEEYEALGVKEIVFKKPKKFKTIKGIKNVETGTVFKNAKKASVGLGVKPQIILEAVGGVRETAANFHWERVEYKEEIK